ncbi:hypothetical protein SEA_DALLAS_185 [Mycobacterium phage Dallas]|nr:hypothetical protein SEA_DALLAS_185 [Mycobacterium phage Dallas]
MEGAVMSRTYRDQKKYLYKHHHEVCMRSHFYLDDGSMRWGWRAHDCECADWWDWSMKHCPVPSWWNRDIRRAERAFTRNKMQRARAGHLDWSAVDEKRGDTYYW